MCEVCYANRAPKSLHFFPCWGPVRCSCGCLIPHISLCSRCWKGLKDINTRPRTTVNPTWSEHGQKAMLQAFQPSADQTTISSTFNLQCINLVNNPDGQEGHPWAHHCLKLAPSNGCGIHGQVHNVQTWKYCPCNWNMQ